jgi:calcineurin-like phosphoesterase
MQTIFLSEKQKLIDSMWEIVLRTVVREQQTKEPFDDAGCDWFTVGNHTYVGDVDWLVSTNEEVAQLVNAINSLYGHTEFINNNPNTIS